MLLISTRYNSSFGGTLQIYQKTVFWGGLALKNDLAIVQGLLRSSEGPQKKKWCRARQGQARNPRKKMVSMYVSGTDTDDGNDRKIAVGSEISRGFPFPSRLLPWVTLDVFPPGFLWEGLDLEQSNIFRNRSRWFDPIKFTVKKGSLVGSELRLYCLFSPVRWRIQKKVRKGCCLHWEKVFQQTKTSGMYDGKDTRPPVQCGTQLFLLAQTGGPSILRPRYSHVLHSRICMHGVAVAVRGPIVRDRLTQQNYIKTKWAKTKSGS